MFLLVPSLPMVVAEKLVVIQKVQKLTKNSQSYNQKQSGTFLWLTVYIQFF